VEIGWQGTSGLLRYNDAAQYDKRDGISQGIGARDRGKGSRQELATWAWDVKKITENCLLMRKGPGFFEACNSLAVSTTIFLDLHPVQCHGNMQSILSDGTTIHLWKLLGLGMTL
jgi:hypothetical protein